MIDRKSWKEFHNSKMLWCANRVLYLFGWAIVMEVDTENEGAIEVYPARVKFRGFDECSEAKGFIRISKFLSENADELLKEAELK